jgi:uncharacterized protein
MTARGLAGAVLAGVGAGIAGGLFGVGGGLLLVPILTGFFHLTQHQAHGTSLAAIGATALASVLVYAAHGNVAWATAALIGIGSAVGARLGARWAARTSRLALTRAFAVFLVLVALRLLWRTPATAAGTTVALTHGAIGLGFDLGLGLAMGLLAGYMGVGGGVIAVPALTLLAGFTQQAAQGTSLAIILITAPVGAYEHARHGNFVGRLVPGLAVGAAIGGPLGSALAQGLSHTVLVRAFALFLLANAVVTWIRSRPRSPARIEPAAPAEAAPPSRG